MAKRPVAKAAPSSILAAVKKVVKNAPANFVGDMTSKDPLLSDVTEWIPSGFPGVDHILGGGWAVGRASEVSGPEGSGKSALTHMAIKGVQSIGGRALVLDWELALERDKVAALGIDPARLDVLYPQYIEQGWDILYEVFAQLKKDPPDKPLLVIWDSVAASIAKAQFDRKSTEDATVAAKARAMSSGIGRLYRDVAEVRAHAMFVNQERAKMGAMAFGPQTDTPGGKELKFYCSQRVRCVRVETLKDQDTKMVRTGYRIATTTNKCRLAPPHQTAKWILDFKVGPSAELTLLEALQDARVVKWVGGVGKVGYMVPWSTEKFAKTDWATLMQDQEFRAQAESAYLTMLDSSNKEDESED